MTSSGYKILQRSFQLYFIVNIILITINFKELLDTLFGEHIIFVNGCSAIIALLCSFHIGNYLEENGEINKMNKNKLIIICITYALISIDSFYLFYHLKYLPIKNISHLILVCCALSPAFIITIFSVPALIVFMLYTIKQIKDKRNRD